MPQKSFTPDEIIRGDFVTWGLSIVDTLPTYNDKSATTDYRRTLRGAVRGLWSGQLGLTFFMTSMATAIDRNFKKVWAEGMKSCGMTLADMSPQEQVYLTQLIRQEYGYIAGFAQSIIDGSKANKGKLAPLLARSDMWVNRLNYVRNQAKTMACADMKGIWKLGQTDHCVDCLNYWNRVYRMSVWRNTLVPYDALPQGHGLACQGFRCQCMIEVTVVKAWPGRPPKPVGPGGKRGRRKIWQALKSGLKRSAPNQAPPVLSIPRKSETS